MKLIDYIELMKGKEDIFIDISCEGTYEESLALEQLCNLEIERERLLVGWSTIISCLIEKFHNKRIVTFLTDKTLDYLINHKICLIDLGHLNLTDKWLGKIYDTDNRCWEALKNIEKRNSSTTKITK